MYCDINAWNVRISMILPREIPGTEFPLAHHLKSFQRNGNVRNAVLVSKKKESSRRWTNNLQIQIDIYIPDHFQQKKQEDISFTVGDPYNTVLITRDFSLADRAGDQSSDPPDIYHRSSFPFICFRSASLLMLVKVSRVGSRLRISRTSIYRAWRPFIRDRRESPSW